MADIFVDVLEDLGDVRVVIDEDIGGLAGDDVRRRDGDVVDFSLPVLEAFVDVAGDFYPPLSTSWFIDESLTEERLQIVSSLSTPSIAISSGIRSFVWFPERDMIRQDSVR